MGLVEVLKNRTTAMTVKEVADMLVTSEASVYRMVKDGELAAITTRSGMRFDPSDVHAVILLLKGQSFRPATAVKPIMRRAQRLS